MSIYLQVIGTSAEANVPPSIFLSSESYRVLFNVGEGTKRLSEEHSVNLNRLTHLFVSNLNWDCWGGLPDLVYELAKCNLRSVDVYGPRELIHYSLSSRYFLYMPGFSLNLREILKENVQITIGQGREEAIVYPVFIEKENFDPNSQPGVNEMTINTILPEVIDIEKTFLTGKEDLERLERMKQIVQNPPTLKPLPENDDRDIRKLDIDIAYDRPSYFRRPKPNHDIISYIINCPNVHPKFDTKHALSLGVPKGPMFGKLTNGESVTLPNGKVVHPHEVLGESKKGPVVIIVYCSGMEYLSNLVKHNKWSNYYQGGQFGEFVSCIVHMTPANIVVNSDYVQWMEKFPKNCQHIILNHDMSSKRPFLLRSEQMITQLREIDNKIFNYSSFDPEPNAKYLSSLPKNLKIIPGEYLLKYQLMPVQKMGVDKSQVPKIIQYKPKESLREIIGIEKAISNYNETRNNLTIELPKYMQSIQENEVELDLYGTGAAVTSHSRNVSGMLLNMFSLGSMLLDCGSGTYSQMCRKYGDRIEDILINMKCVWISHKHPDHHNGIIPILAKRQIALKKRGIQCEPITIIGPRLFRGYLEEINMVSPWGIDFKFYHYSLLMKDVNVKSEIRDFLYKTFGFNEVIATKAIHGGDASCLAITHKKGWKIVLSGDTRPTKQLVEAGKNCTLLVYEATFCSHDRNLALTRAHSTTAEALHMAYLMQASFLLLTHFSQRQNIYPVSDFLDNPEEEDGEQVTVGDTTQGDPVSKFKSDDEILSIDPTYPQISLDRALIAFDLMSINWKDLHVVPKLMPIFKCLNMDAKKKRREKKNKNKE